METLLKKHVEVSATLAQRGITKATKEDQLQSDAFSEEHSFTTGDAH